MPLELRLMRYVIAVAETGSFQGAARRLHMAQPPLSRQIRDLERELGVRLFERHPTRLTEAGHAFVESARQVLRDTEHAVQRARQAGRAETGTVGVGYGPTAAYEEMPKLLTAMSERHPGIRCEVREDRDVDLAAALGEGRLDAVLGRLPPVPTGCETEVLRREPYIVLVADGHRLAGRGAVRLCELRGETFRFVARRIAPRYFDGVLAALHSTGETFEVWENPVTGLRTYQNLHHGGFMLVPCTVSRHLPGGIVALEVLDDLPRIDVELTWRPEAASPALAALVATAREVACAEGWTR